ncbi:DUF2332 domain-containing protein [Allopontixanthobacter sp.]|uniref:DUF2332 domain-containing protein n=1 Tax=Allopontixanthobacter sp. TaxID=2906452 RepID=UPI002ABC0F8A|nr:DUF2332 domain-containing protein [Allopontixanthobacter sp.]MDZ4308334.1 DUF2332 domain-containing protein [Allopontixanthobacter sp.]
MTDAIMDIATVAGGIEWQARHAEQAGAPCTGRVVRAQLAVLDSDTATGRRMAGWQGKVVEDALPLRLAGGLHNLVLTGEDRRLEPVYAGLLTDQGQVDAIVLELVRKYDTRLLPWLDGPPQTNEAGRSWAFMSALKWLSVRLGPKFSLFELGASAGVNTMMDRYFFDLGGVTEGPPASPMRIVPEWRGAPPPDAPVEIISIRGCDQAPIDLGDPAMALKLKSYVWPEASQRIARIDAAIALAAEKPPIIAHQDAGPFVDEMLAEAPQVGVTRVLLHSIVWQYIPPVTRDRIEAAMAKAGAEATPENPLAWVALETNRETFRHELRVRYWPGGEEPQLLGCGHPHGAWAEWFAA